MQQARQLGRYQLLDRVAFGGMAEIYRAKTADADGRLHLVAVKRVLGHLCEDEEFIQMLVDEAKITAALQHENIARIYEFCRTDREYFIAMEYVDGKDVRALLEKARQNQESVPEEHVARIGMEVARALHAAHTQRDREGRPLRIVHRDVSPSNVLLSYRGEVKLCDFGIAKATLTRVQTKTGVIKGKVKYMSPEQAMGRKLDHRSDLFSLGTLLYEMLTLQAPFQAPTEIELIFAVRDARKRALAELRPETHPALLSIVDRAMARSRSQRYQSGEELAQALEGFLAQHHAESRRSHFGRYMRNVFGKEIDRELRMLEEYVIEGGSTQDVGENLIADVLGPNAPYTQFTAAFNEGQQDLLDMPTAEKVRVAPEDLLEAPPPPGRVGPIVDPALLPRAAVPMAGGDYRTGLDAGWGPDPVFEPLKAEPQAEADDDLHREQTRILTRARIEAETPDLHEAHTRIFSVEQVRQAPRPPAPRPVTPWKDPLPPLDSEFHDAETAFLQRAPLAPRAPAPEPRPAEPPEAPEPPESEEQPTQIETTAQVRLRRQHPRAEAPGPPRDTLSTLDQQRNPLQGIERSASFNNEPTGLKDPDQKSGSVELSSADLAFIDGPFGKPEGDERSSALTLDDDDLEALD